MPEPLQKPSIVARAAWADSGIAQNTKSKERAQRITVLTNDARRVATNIAKIPESLSTIVK